MPRKHDRRPPGADDNHHGRDKTAANDDQGLFSTRATLIGLIAIAAGTGMVLAGQPWLAIPAAVGVAGGLHALVKHR